MDKFIKRKHSSDACESESERSSKATKPSNNKTKARAKRQYCNSYLKFGFHWTGNEDQPFPLCVVCGERMSNEGMVPSKLKRHFTTKHTHLQDKDLNYFQRLLLEQQSKQRNNFQKKLTVCEKAQVASIEIAEMIALQTKSHTLAESIMLPACRKMVHLLNKEKASTVCNCCTNHGQLETDVLRLKQEVATLSAKVESLEQRSGTASHVGPSHDVHQRIQEAPTSALTGSLTTSMDESVDIEFTKEEPRYDKSQLEDLDVNRPTAGTHTEQSSHTRDETVMMTFPKDEPIYDVKEEPEELDLNGLTTRTLSAEQDAYRI